MASQGQATATTTEDHFFGCIIYGKPGIGKTSLVAHAPDLAFVCDPHERGIDHLVRFKQCPKPKARYDATGWKHLLNTLESIAGRRDIKNVAFDSMTGLEQLCFQYHCKEYYSDDWSSQGFYSYMQGPKNAAKRDWPDFIQAMQNIRDSGKNVWIIGHADVKQVDNPDGPNYSKVQPYLDKESWAALHRWATMILLYKLESEIKKDGAKFKSDTESERHILLTAGSTTCDAKNGYGLSPVINTGTTGQTAYNALMKEYMKAYRR